MVKDDLIIYDYDNQIIIDNKDKEILYELSTDARQPNSKIGKKVNLSKQSVAKRIEILEKTGVITNYFISINTLNTPIDYALLIKLNHNLTDEEIQNKIFQVGDISAIWWCLPNYDLKIIITTPDANELNNKVNNKKSLFFLQKCFIFVKNYIWDIVSGYNFII